MCSKKVDLSVKFSIVCPKKKGSLFLDFTTHLALVAARKAPGGDTADLLNLHAVFSPMPPCVHIPFCNQ